MTTNEEIFNSLYDLINSSEEAEFSFFVGCIHKRLNEKGFCLRDIKRVLEILVDTALLGAEHEKGMKPRLVDMADGVKGRYCIARSRPDGFVEYWDVKQSKWCSAGTVIELTD